MFMHIPYNRQADPKALFAQGFQNMLGGIQQGSERRRFGEALEGVDPEATLMQIISQMLTGGATPQQAMGIGTMMQRGLMSPSQQISAEKLYLYKTTGDPKHLASMYMDFGKMPGFLKGGTEGETQRNIERYRKKQLEPTEDTPLTDPQIAGYGERMATRLGKAKRHLIKQVGRINYPEKELFKQWKIFCGMYKFKNDTQKEQVWNLWQNEIKNKSAEGWFGKETDFNPTDPKWRKAIGLKAEVAGKELTETEVRALLSEVGGDVQKARQLAKERGWVIPK